MVRNLIYLDFIDYYIGTINTITCKYFSQLLKDFLSYIHTY